MSPPDPHERIVTIDTPLPPDYHYVPSGSPYITRHCRSRTHALHKPVYIVHSARNQPLGIRVPKHVYHAVMSDERASREDRKSAVARKDGLLREKMEKEILRQFSGIPGDVVGSIATQSLKKRSGRVGRAGAVDLEESAGLAVGAWVRHRMTGYDALLRGGVGREEARRGVWGEVRRVLGGWRGGEGEGKGEKLEKMEKMKSSKVSKTIKRTRKTTAEVSTPDPRTSNVRVLTRSGARLAAESERVVESPTVRKTAKKSLAPQHRGSRAEPIDLSSSSPPSTSTSRRIPLRQPRNATIAALDLRTKLPDDDEMDLFDSSSSSTQVQIPLQRPLHERKPVCKRTAVEDLLELSDESFSDSGSVVMKRHSAKGENAKSAYPRKAPASKIIKSTSKFGKKKDHKTQQRRQHKKPAQARQKSGRKIAFRKLK